MSQNRFNIEKLTEIDEKIKQHKDVLDLTNKVPSILQKMKNGEKLSEQELGLVKEFGIYVSEDQKFERHAEEILKRLHCDEESKREHVRYFLEAKAERDRIVRESNQSSNERPSNSDFQDSSDITGETEPFDPLDLEG